MSSSPKAKFAPRRPTQPSVLTEAEKHAFAFAEEVRGLAVSIVDAAIAEAVFAGERDPKIYGLALLCRSISNFQGALTMVRLDQAVESRTLVRCCFENLFLVDKLLKHGAAYVQTMRSHDAASRISIGVKTLKRPGFAESPAGKTVRGFIKSQRAEFTKPSKLTVSDTAKGRDRENVSRLRLAFTRRGARFGQSLGTPLSRDGPPCCRGRAAVQAEGAAGDAGHGMQRGSWRVRRRQ
jgi:hypothetical protein